MPRFPRCFLGPALAAALGSFALAACSSDGAPGAAPPDGGTTADDGGTVGDDGGTIADDGATAAGDWGTATNVEAIFASSCASCHGQTWASCWSVQACAATVEGAVSSGAMPRGRSLSAADKNTLLTWLGEGAPCAGTNPDAGGGCSLPLEGAPVGAGASGGP